MLVRAFSLEMAKATKLISPYGDKLVDLTSPNEDLPALRDRASRLFSLQLSQRCLCDLELLATGAFSPLDRFMGKNDFESSVCDMRLGDGKVFPIPISLPVASDTRIKLDSDIVLCDSRNNPLAVMTVEEIYEWDRRDFSNHVLGTTDLQHPLNAEMRHWGDLNISGKLRVISLPKHFDFQGLRLTPQQTRAEFNELGNSNVVAFQTRNPLHRGHEEICRRAINDREATLLLHPSVGLTREGDVDAFTRVRCYEALIDNYFEKKGALLALVPLAMRMAGPREAVWHMLIRRNYGANHFIVGRDHASPGKASNGKPFYGSKAAQELALRCSDELGVKVLPYDEIGYLPNENRYAEISEIEQDATLFSMSGTKLRDEYLSTGERPPDWFVRPEVSDVLMQRFSPLNGQGVCIWFTGLSAAGKSTIAEILTVLLNEQGRNVTLLDGDIVRTHLSKGLGFSREDRDANVLRIGFVAAEVVKHGGVAVCAAISPFAAARGEVRDMFEAGRFVEVFVDTPIRVCEQRDVKGVYQKARRGELKNFTGIDDPYETPVDAEVVLDNVKCDAEENARKIMHYLVTHSIISAREKISSMNSVV